MAGRRREDWASVRRPGSAPLWAYLPTQRRPRPLGLFRLSKSLPCEIQNCLDGQKTRTLFFRYIVPFRRLARVYQKSERKDHASTTRAYPCTKTYPTGLVGSLSRRAQVRKSQNPQSPRRVPRTKLPELMTMKAKYGLEVSVSEISTVLFLICPKTVPPFRDGVKRPAHRRAPQGRMTPEVIVEITLVMTLRDPAFWMGSQVCRPPAT